MDDPTERAALLAEGKEMLRRGAVGHNHLWFYRDAIEALLSAGATERVPWNMLLRSRTTRGPSRCPGSDLFATRGRLLAGAARCNLDDGRREHLIRIRTALHNAGLMAFLPPIEAALALDPIGRHVSLWPISSVAAVQTYRLSGNGDITTDTVIVRPSLLQATDSTPPNRTARYFAR